jgi:hypothetical protein
MSILSEKYSGLINRVKGYEPETPTERLTDIPEKYKTVPGGTEYNVDPSLSAKFRNLPSFMGGGQYILDPEQKGALIKSIREYDPIQKNKIMQGLSSRFFQVDHRMPLWAGGTDTDTNKERLTIEDHEQKTKVGTVARTLYYNDKLSLSGARTMLLGWKDRDVAGVMLTDKGELSTDSTEALSRAIHLKNEWAKPKEVKVGWKDVWSEMKRNPIIRGAQSLASGFTAGWYKPEYAPVEEGKELETTIADMTGHIAGTIASFATLQGVLVQGSRLLGLKNLFSGVQSYKTLQSSKAAISAGKIKVAPQTGMRMLHNAGLFTLHGQMSRDAFEGDRANRFLSDAAFGSIVGAAGNTLKSYAGLGAGVYGLGILEGASPKESLMNSAIMIGFHRIGQKGRVKRVQNLAEAESIRYLSLDSGVKIFPEKINPKTKKPYAQEEMLETYVPGSVKFTEKDANRIMNDAFKNLEQSIKNTPEAYTPQLINQIKSKILTSTRQLYKSSLGEEARLLEDIRDVKSLVKRENVNKEINTDLPKKQYEALIKDVGKINSFEKGNVTKEEASFLKKHRTELPTGVTPVTGTAMKINGKNILTAMDEGLEKGSKVIIAKRKDLVGFSKELNSKAGHWTDLAGNPNHFLEVYYPGTNKLIRTGVLASENRILNRKHSMIPSSYTEKDFNPKMNKDNIGKAMDKTNVDYLVAEVNHVRVSKFTKEPSMTIRILPESYSISKAKVGEKQLPKMLKEGKPVYDHLFGEGSFYKRLSEENKIKLKSLSLVGKEKASDVISTKDMSSGYKHLSSVMFKPLEKAFVTNDIKKIRDAFKETVGVNVSKETAGKFAADKKLDVGKVIETIEGARRRVKVEKDIVKIQEVKSKFEKVGKVEKEISTPKTVKLESELRAEKSEASVGISEDRTKIEPVKDREIPDKAPITVSEAPKESFHKDWATYEYGTQKGIIKPFDEVILKLRNSGSTEKAKQLEDLKKLFTRENLKVLSKKIFKENNGDYDSSFAQFKTKYTNIFKKLGKENPFDDHKNSQSLRHHFNLLVQYTPYRKIVFENGKYKTYNATDKAGSYLTDEIVKYKVKNPKAGEIDIVYVDSKQSKFSSKRSYDQKNEVFDVLNKKDSGYYPFASSDKEIKNILAMKRNEYLSSQFDKNPKKYLQPNESAGLLSSADKQLKVFVQDVLGFDKSIPIDKVIKRIKLIDTREIKNTVPLRNYSLHVLKSPKLKDVKEASEGKFWEGIDQKDIEKAFDKAIYDGKIFITKGDMSEITSSMGFIGGRSRIKPVMAHKQTIDGKESLVIQKGDISVLDDVFQKYFEKQLGKKLKKGDIVTFEDNIKVGDIKDTGKGYGLLDVPSDSFRFKYSNPHKPGGSMSLSVFAQFAEKDGINKALKEVYNPEVKNFTGFVKELNGTKNGDDVIKVFQKHPEYGIDIERDMWDSLLLKIKNGAGINLANKQLNDVVNQIFEKRILKGSFLKGDHLTLSLDVGVKNGKFLKPGEVMLSRKTWEELGSPAEIMTIRYPVTHKLAISKDKVLIAEDYGVKSLGKEQAVVNHRDVIINKQADTDGDSIHIFSLGKKSSVPESVANNVEKTRNSTGDIVLKDLEKFDPKAVTAKNASAVTDNILLGDDGIKTTSSIKRVMESVVDANTKIVVKNVNGKKVVETYLGSYRTPFRQFTSKEKIKPGFKDETFTVKFNEKEKRDTFQLLQESVDAAASKNLSQKMGSSFNDAVLLKEFVRTTDKDVIKALRSTVSYFQDPFQFGVNMKNNVDVFNKIKTANTKTSFVEKNGGKVGPVQSIVKLFEENLMEPLTAVSGKGDVYKKIQFGYDQAGRNNVIKKYKDRFDIGNLYEGSSNFVLNVKENSKINRTVIRSVVNKIKELSNKYETINSNINYSVLEKNEAKKIVRNKFTDFWNLNKTKLNQEERDAVSYYMTTAYDANISLPRKYFDKNMRDKMYYTYRLENIFNEASSTVARAYNLGAESFRLVESKTKEPIIKNSLLNVALSVKDKAVYSKGVSPMTIKK